jgi:hypothetical protein
MSRKHHMGKTRPAGRGARCRARKAGRSWAGGNQSRRFEDLGIYGLGDMAAMQGHTRPGSGYHTRMRSLDELLERDKQREADGFPRKIRIGKLIKPGKSGKDKVVVVPSTVEEKFIHDSQFFAPERGIQRRFRGWRRGRGHRRGAH